MNSLKITIGLIIYRKFSIFIIYQCYCRIMAKRIIAGLLSDGRLQLWAVNESDGSMQTRWKQTTHPDASWTN